MQFELAKLKNIPVLDIAHLLGIKVNKKKAMCFRGHDKKTPSLSFDLNNNLFYCFGCGVKGDNIRLVEECLEVDFKKACGWLYDKFNLSVTGNMSLHDRKNFYYKPEKDRVSITKNEDFLPDPEVYEWLLRSCSLSSEAIKYLTSERGFNIETLTHFNIKDITRPNDKFLEARSFWGLERLIKCGLAVRMANNRASFIWWNHVILFPFYNSKNKIVYIQGRQLGNREPRYRNLNGVQTEIFNLTLIDKIEPDSIIYICEGITDALSAYQVGLNAVGIMGANGFKEEWAIRFIDYRLRVIPDTDTAGERFASVIEDAFKKIGKSIQIIKLAKGKDLCDFVRITNKS